MAARVADEEGRLVLIGGGGVGYWRAEEEEEVEGWEEEEEWVGRWPRWRWGEEWEEEELGVAVPEGERRPREA